MQSVFVIAEVGVNHNGSKELAFQLVDAAVDAGADAVKFQTFKTENLVTKNTGKASYQKQATDSEESQFSMLKKLELTYDDYYELFEYCKKRGIEFLATAFDLDSLNFLANELRLKTLKIPSGEITNGPLLLAYAKTGCNIILSTGMATLAEIEESFGVLIFGLLSSVDSTVKPSTAAFQNAYGSTEGYQLLKERVTLLHCTTEYPTLPQDVNLKAMSAMRDMFDLKTGYSDHSEGIVVPIVAASLGAVIIEKHFTLKKTLPGPDHKASLDPVELAEMIHAIRIVEQVMGSGIKRPMPGELNNRLTTRKSLVASSAIVVGEKFSDINITTKRAGVGISPMEYWDVIGRRAKYDFDKDDVISLI